MRRDVSGIVALAEMNEATAVVQPNTENVSRQHDLGAATKQSETEGMEDERSTFVRFDVTSTCLPPCRHGTLELSPGQSAAQSYVLQHDTCRDV